MTIDHDFFSFLYRPVIKFDFWEFKLDVWYKCVFFCEAKGYAIGEVVFICFCDIRCIDAFITIGDRVPNLDECFNIQFFYDDVDILRGSTSAKKNSDVPGDNDIVYLEIVE